MLFDALNRRHLLKAAEILDVSGESSHTDFWMRITETGKDYPFKLIVRKAYEYATGKVVEPGFFRNSHFYRRYFQHRFDYEVFFKVRDNIPFFTEGDLDYYASILDQPYRSGDPDSTIIGENLKMGVFKKTNTWARALNSEELEINNDTQWQIAGNYKRYSWATIFKSGDNDKKIFFTVGVDADEEALIYKLDCQRKSRNPELRLSDAQISIFDRIVGSTEAKWKSIYKTELTQYTWNSLIDITADFIDHYMPLYNEVMDAVWKAEPKVEQGNVDDLGLDQLATFKGC